MGMPLKKEWIDKRELAQVVGPDSCLVIKDSDDLIVACNKDGKIGVEKLRMRG